MTEYDIQRALFYYLNGRGHEIISPNCHHFGWESDLLVITKTGRAHEYEIKISRADFKADAKKERHLILTNNSEQGPSRFWYVAPPNIIDPSELPEYAGLLELQGEHFIAIKQPPQRNRNLISDVRKNSLYRSLMFRYWRMRNNIPNTGNSQSILMEERECF